MVRTMLAFLPPCLRAVLLILLWLAASSLGGWLGYQGFVKIGLETVVAAGNNRLDLYAASLRREIDKFAFLPDVVALQPEILSLLQSPGDERLQSRANLYLEELSRRAGTLSVYMLDHDGHVLAASNWRRADSFVGENLGFRPYVQQALREGRGRYFGVGTTRGEPGYYLTTTLGQGEMHGVVVVKVGLAQLEQSWASAESPVLVSDENTVVILSNMPAWRFATLLPLDEARRAELEASQKYNRLNLRPLGWRGMSNVTGVRQVSIPDVKDAAADQSAGRFLAQSRPMAGTPWQITVLSPLSVALQLAASRAWVTGALIALMLLLGALLYQRRRHVREQLAAQQALKQANEVLENKVQQRTADLQSANVALQQEVMERMQAETTLRAAQDELVQAGKLAVIGQLSTEVAHELNQPLAALRALAGNSQRFLERGQSEMVQSNLQRMAELTERMGRITGQLRNFARKSAGQPEQVELAKVVDGALSLMEPRIAQSGVMIVRQPSDLELSAWCDANRVQQVLINLLSNALDAVQGGNTRCVEIACNRCGAWAQITVRDHGPGLSDQAQARLFEPFFTTKPEGLGLGLGLPLSAEIAQAAGGSLTGGNHPEGGAIFTLSLPLVDTRPLS